MTLSGEQFLLAILLVSSLVIDPLVARRVLAGFAVVPEDRLPPARRRIWRQTLAATLVATILLTLAWLALGRTLPEIGLRLPSTSGQWLAFAAIGLGTAILCALTLRDAAREEELVKVRAIVDGLGHLPRLAPRTGEDLRLLDLVALNAGVCEEILYRGLLFTLLAESFGLPAAVVLSTVVFALGHAYQGINGMVRCGLYGLAMIVVFLMTGSLWMAIVAHAAFDMAQARLIRNAMNLPADPDAFEHGMVSC